VNRDWDALPQRPDEADFAQLLAVLSGGVPVRPTLFEFYLNARLYRRAVPGPEPADDYTGYRRRALAFHRLGYDYSTLMIPGFTLAEGIVRPQKETYSLDAGSVIRSRADFDAFAWPDPDRADYGMLERLAADLPPGMKLIPYSPNGVLENVIDLMGYQALCIRLLEDRQLVEDVFAEVGERLLRYYSRAVRHDCVGACLANDDWGFNTSTLLSPEALRQLVFPWYRRIVEAAHAAGKPVILHSCGYFEEIIEDVIEDLRFDGRHSYEDQIVPVEEAYDRFHGRIAILGGIDVDFICRSSPEDVYRRARDMLERAAENGGFALGTGNSVPDYMPDANFLALIRAALDLR
jgi:uroporphyrinogen decarboxylase